MTKETFKDPETMTDAEILAELGFGPSGPTAAQLYAAEDAHNRRFQAEVSAAINDTPTAEAAARAVYAVVRRYCEAMGYKPDIETFIRSPQESLDANGVHGACWVVSWESGPFQWAVGASLGGHNRLVEPYYSFDLTFFPAEWPQQGG